VGDRIAGFVHGARQADPVDLISGCFSEYSKVKDGAFIRVPENLSNAEASTLGVGVATVGQALYQAIPWPLPPTKLTSAIPILIYGGSSATGALAVQYAKASGATVITTASTHNHSYLKQLGADACFDYHEPDCATQIQTFAEKYGGLHLALDTISTKDSLKIVNDAISHSNPPADAAAGTPDGKNIVVTLIADQVSRKDIDSRWVLAYTSLGEHFYFRQNRFEAKPEDYEFGQKFWKISEGLLANGTIKPHQPDVRKGGIEAIQQGLNDLKENRVSGKKVVYEL
jgi:NADPH:quinone reductase-like Zn-dependent oxidoreductase